MMSPMSSAPGSSVTRALLVLVLGALSTAVDAQLAAAVDRQTSKKPNGRPLTEVLGADCLCGSFTDPVCGRNGQTYSNPCWARCAGLVEEQWRVGACGKKPPPGGVNSGASCSHVRLCEHIFEAANVGGGVMACGWCHVGSEAENGHAIPCAQDSQVCDPMEPCVGAFYDTTTTCPSSFPSSSSATPTPTPTAIWDTSLEITPRPEATPTPTPETPISSATPEATITPESDGDGIRINAGEESVGNVTMGNKPPTATDVDEDEELLTTPDAMEDEESEDEELVERDETEAAVVGVWSNRRGKEIASDSALFPDCAHCVANGSAALVCGSNGATYMNACEADCRGVGLRHVGRCSSADGGARSGTVGSHMQAACMAFCRMSQRGLSKRVCGDDGRTHGSSCEAACGGVSVVAWQPCECMCTTGRTISEAGRLLDVRSGCKGNRKGQAFCFTAGECVAAERRVPISRATRDEGAVIEDALFSRTCELRKDNIGLSSPVAPNEFDVAETKSFGRGTGRKWLQRRP